MVCPEVAAIAVSSGASLSASGVGNELELAASGGAVADLGSLQLGRLDVDLSGGAVARVSATEAVEGDASGGAVLTVLGDPTRIDVATSGGALIGRE